MTVQYMVNALSQRFGVYPKLVKHKKLSRAYYRPISNEIHYSEYRSSIDTILHEYAHALVGHRPEYKMPPKVYDAVNHRYPKEMYHGDMFQTALWDVATFWYGDASKYNWQREYARVRKWGLKRVSRQPEVKMRRVFCSCGFAQETVDRDTAFDVAVAHRNTHPDRPFLDTKISTEFESPKGLNASNVVKDRNTPNGEKRGNMFTIETGLPIPESTRKGKTEKYPFSQMAVGQSFFVPAGDNSDVVKTVGHAAYSAEKRLEAKGKGKVRFAVRPATVETESDGEVVTVSGCRVWRTKDSE